METNKFINGGAEVWGSIYVEGNDPTQYVIDSNGNFQQHNFYTKDSLKALTGLKDSELANLRLETLEQKDLCATVRVRKGKIEVGGSTNLGDDASTVPAGFKNTLAGVYVGYGAPSIDRVGGAQIYADSIGQYDLVPPLDFPLLDTGAAGQKYCRRDPNLTWRQCLQEDADPSKTTGFQILQGTTTWPADVSCNIPSTTTNLVFGATPRACYRTIGGEKLGFEYTYDAGTKQGSLQVYGLVDLQGFDVEFEEDVAVRFTDKATLFVERNAAGVGGNVVVDGSILPQNSFPDQDVLGIIADKNLTFTGDQQNFKASLGLPGKQVAMGLFYAGGTAYVEKGSIVMGTLMTQAVESTSNHNAGQSAKIMEVPGLDRNPAPGFESLPQSNVATFESISVERR